jgi:hypothetical protein
MQIKITTLVGWIIMIFLVAIGVLFTYSRRDSKTFVPTIRVVIPSIEYWNETNYLL